MTPDSNGLLTMEETDPIAPFQTLINALLASYSDRFGPVLPDPQTATGSSVQGVTAATFTNIPNIDTLSFNLPRACWFDLRFATWITGTPAFDIRAGINVSGATTSVPSDPEWGSVIRRSAPGGGAALGGDAAIAQKTILLNAGSNTISAQAYVAGSTVAAGTNYAVLTATPLRWAAS